jgi:hypothetical protein
MAEGLTDAQIVERLQRLERNVRLLAERAGVQIEDASEGIDADIVELANQGDRMGAAKLYTERTGADFVTAQGVVNRIGH